MASKKLGFVLIAGAFALLSVPASAQPTCPEGMTASGACVNPAFARSMRMRNLALSQPKFSYTAPSRLPSEDADAPDIPTSWHELYNLYTYPPVTSVRPGRATNGPDRP